MLPIITEITELFVGAGVHLDAINRDGLTASQLCNSSKCYTFNAVY